MKHWWKIAIGLAVIVGGIWVVRVVTTPPPGTQMADQGRDHVTPEQVVVFKYNSNPPTSGPHLATWVKPGIYDTPQQEGELIHSLEHGYVIISYNCNVHLNASLPVIPAFTLSLLEWQAGIQKNGSPIGVGDDKIIHKVFAHEDEGSPSADFVDPIISTGSAVNGSDGCKSLVKQLEGLARKKKLFKLVVVPRPQLDTTVALTAWTYIDKFDPPAGGFDTGRIERFIDFHRDQGPEKTME